MEQGLDLMVSELAGTSYLEGEYMEGVQEKGVDGSSVERPDWRLYTPTSIPVCMLRGILASRLEQVASPSFQGNEWSRKKSSREGCP